MKKRLFFLLLIPFLLCGCRAEVNITINNDVVSESITINEETYDVFTINDIAQQYRKYVPAFYNVPIIDTMPDVKQDGVAYYKTTSNAAGDTYRAYYQYSFRFKEYKNATSLRNAFKSSEVQYDPYEKQILFTTDASGMTIFQTYPQLTEVRVNIKTGYQVMETNADYQNGDVYTWIFYRNTKKNIYMLLHDPTGKSVGGIKKEEPKKEPEEEEPGEEEPEPQKEQPNNNNNNNNNKKPEEKTELQQRYEKIQEQGKKHPYIVVIIAVGVFFVVVLLTMKVKKV